MNWQPIIQGLIPLAAFGALVLVAVGATAWLTRGRTKPQLEPLMSFDLFAAPQPEVQMPLRHVHTYRGGWPKRWTDADFDRFLADCLTEQDQTGDETR